MPNGNGSTHGHSISWEARAPSGQINGDGVPHLSKHEEDELLREATGGFPEWIASFIRRVILLFDNLPEEAGGATEGELM